MADTTPWKRVVVEAFVEAVNDSEASEVVFNTLIPLPGIRAVRVVEVGDIYMRLKGPK